MKKTIILILMVSMIMIFSVPAYAENEDIVKPPKDTRSVIGKVIEFTDPTFNPNHYNWFIPIIGAEKFQVSMAEGVVFFVPCNTFYYNQRIEFIIYSSSVSGIEWSISYENGGKREIKVISIQ